jgi:TonB-dependent SusC/RagA subfamily outer membrane receptor
MRNTIITLFIFFQSFLSFGQYSSNGMILDENKMPLPGASVVNITQDKGVVTNFDGEFSIETKEGDVIEVSYVGYQAILIKNTFQNGTSFQLIPDSELEEVVITALGIKRAEKALGYSVQGIKASEISKVKASNVVNSLAGKIAGVSITGSAAGPSASSNINIRGASSLMGNNQPLFVVNGMPITNELYSFDDGLNGSSTIDFGNAVQIINTDDIDAISVLKGPAASALYGSRAANGVILIETKNGTFQKEGFGVELNTSIQFSNPLKLPHYQNEFGSGGGGKYSCLNGSTYIGANQNYDAYGENWGPRMNGQLIKQFNSNGEAVPFTPAPNNVRDFYQTGILQSTNVAINNSSATGQSRFS